MDERLRKVESELSDVKSDIRLQKEILSSINDTLKEMREANRVLHSIDMKLVHIEGDIESHKNQIKALFNYKEDSETRLRVLERSDTVKSVKIGSAETLYVIVATAIIGAVVTMVKWG